MSSKLIVTSVEGLQKEVVRINKALFGVVGIYLSLNRPQKNIEEELALNGVDTSKIFFIDCVSSDNVREDVLHIGPENVDKIGEAIKDFIKEIPNEKFLLIDALSTLLIYNSEEKVAAFVKEMIDYSLEKDVIVLAVSPQTKGENLLNKIYNFFDEVVETEKVEEVTSESGEDFIY